MESHTYTHESLKNLRLSDLREILKKLDLSSTGNKEQLIQRILSYPRVAQIQYNSNNLISNFANEIPVDNQCICTKGSGSTVSCSRCNKLLHAACIGTNASIQPYECTTCQMEQMEPLDRPIKFLSMPRLLNKGSFIQTTTEILLDYNSSLKAQVLESRGKLQIQVRSLKLDNTGYTQTWPKTGCLKVNSKIASEFRQNPNPNAKKRKDSPCNITHLLDTGLNSISLVKSNDEQDYAVAVILVEMLVEDALISEIETRNIQPLEESKAYVRDIMKSDTDELVSEMQTVSLRCPYAMNLLSKPARGVRCKHIQCFNLDSYIKLQRRSKANRWKCPICKEFAFNLYVDKFMEQICKDACELDDAYQVKIYNDSSYQILLLDDVPSNELSTSHLNIDSPRSRSCLETIKRNRDFLSSDILSKRIKISEDKKENMIPSSHPLIRKPIPPSQPVSSLLQSPSTPSSTPQKSNQSRFGTSDCPIELD
jgi:hypothetical protein